MFNRTHKDETVNTQPTHYATIDEAIETIERAISIEPENQYFRDQKEKFIETKKTASQSA